MKRNGFNWNKSQRMQVKAFVCVLGLLLLLILLIARIFFALIHRGEKQPEEPPVPIPVVEELPNVWVMETAGGQLKIFRDGAEESYSYSSEFVPQEDAREQIADVVLTDGLVTGMTIKTEKIGGKLLGADGDRVLLEGYGYLPLAADYKGYRLYNSLEMCTLSDLAYGYDFTDFILEDGEICGILMAKEEAMENIRVLLKAAYYEGNYHQELTVGSDTNFIVEYGSSDTPGTERFSAGEELTLSAQSEYFDGERIVIRPEAVTGKIYLKNVNRSQGIPAYRGSLEVYLTQDGMVVINELPLEEYLYSVVPSEMPASYPAQALKAQAICARTYAYGHMQRAAYPEYGAHVDDSTSYQVYNNILEQESATTAVKESYGQLLFTAEGSLAGTYYYSTSCGVGTDANVWKTEEASTLTYLKPREIASSDTEGEEELPETLTSEEAFAAFITGKNANDYEVSESWYRWNYQVKELDPEFMCEILKKRYEVNEKLILTLEKGEYVSRPVQDFSRVTDLYVEKRGPGGICDELIIETDRGIYKVISEHNIRCVLNDGESQVMRQDGKKVDAPVLLPSGFFVLKTIMGKNQVTGYTLTGGGFGHGVGMSQNGAKNMAKQGMDAEEILAFFYDGCRTENIYEGE